MGQLGPTTFWRIPKNSNGGAEAASRLLYNFAIRLYRLSLSLLAPYQSPHASDLDPHAFLPRLVAPGVRMLGLRILASVLGLALDHYFLFPDRLFRVSNRSVTIDSMEESPIGVVLLPEGSKWQIRDHDYRTPFCRNKSDT